MTDESYTRVAIGSRPHDLDAVSSRTGGRITIEQVSLLAQVALRLDPALAGRVPYPLPLEPNTAWETDARAALRLGPDEWLVLGPHDTAADIVDELDSSLDGEHRSVIDVSANRVVIELGGARRFELLAGGCSLDLHPRSWRAGMCAQTLFARTQLILHERAGTTRLLVRPSFADYLIDRLLVALESEPA